MVNKGKILGIDYGKVRIGIAISDVDQKVAFGRSSLKNISRKEVIREIKRICADENVSKIVIGHPLALDGKKTDQTMKVEEFGNELEEEIKLPIIYHDERLTSIESSGILTALNIRGKERKEKKDKIAASLILQNYLDLIGK